MVLEEGDFRRADIEATQTVEIVEFVPLEEIDPMFFDKPYYLEPQKNGAKAYALLREALKRSGKVGIAKVVIKTRQHLASIKPEDKALVLELMHFAEELVEPTALQIPGNPELGARIGNGDRACRPHEAATGNRKIYRRLPPRAAGSDS